MSEEKREIQVRKVNNADDLDQVFEIRKKVFVEEQKCPPELEWENEEESVHFIALVNGRPAGAARWRMTGKGFKLERFAVLKVFRGIGVGQELVRTVLDDVPGNAKNIYLNAQVQAVKLYEKFGFVTEGDEFLEAGIRHYKMVLK